MKFRRRLADEGGGGLGRLGGALDRGESLLGGTGGHGIGELGLKTRKQRLHFIGIADDFPVEGGFHVKDAGDILGLLVVKPGKQGFEVGQLGREASRGAGAGLEFVTHARDQGAQGFGWRSEDSRGSLGTSARHQRQAKQNGAQPGPRQVSSR